MFRRIVLEAESVEEALDQLTAEVTAGYEVLEIEVLTKSRTDTITCSAPTVEGAFRQARHKVPKSAALTEEKQLRPAGTKSIAVEAADESAARLEVERQVEEGTKIQHLELEKPGSGGFLGIGRKPNRYRAQVFQPAVVQVSYRLRAKASATLMSAEAAGLARDAVEKLLEIHRAGPASEAVAVQMRSIGNELESIGGVDLMLAAHHLFRRQAPDAGPVLEEAWDGIGAWIS